MIDKYRSELIVRDREEFAQKMLELLGSGRMAQEEPMARHTTFRVGGPARFYLTPGKEQLALALQACIEYGIPYLVVGNGSNLLVSDRGFDGAVIEVGKEISQIRIEGQRIYADAGALLSRVASVAQEAGLAGMEFASGIPGCVGGAVVMNAGAYGGEIKDVLEEVTVLGIEGEVKRLPASELALSYRHSSIPQNRQIVLEASLVLQPGDAFQIKERMEELRSRRIQKQPLDYPSAGSTFKRPEGYFAGKLIMDAGLRGFRIGDAAVSEKHCGFVVNLGSATAADIYRLICEVQQEVQRQFGVHLEPEIKMVGDFA